MGELNQQEADRLVGQTLEAGINFFDMAEVYANGEAERILGKALGSHRRDVIIATKVFGRSVGQPIITGHLPEKTFWKQLMTASSNSVLT